MKDKDKAQGQLNEELKRLRQRVSELEIADAERERAEVEVQRQKKRFKAIAENSSDVIILVDNKGAISYESPAMEQLLGLNPRERIGANVFERLHPDDVAVGTKIFQWFLDNPGGSQRAEMRLKHKDGSWRTVEAVATAVAHDSIVEGMVVNLRDISERKKAEEALRQSEERFRALIESSLDVVAIVDAKGTVLYQSPNYSSVWGRDPAGESGRDMFKDVHPDDIPLVGDNFVRLLKKPGEPLQLQLRAMHTDGTWHNVELVAHNHLKNPVVRGIVVNLRDVTERKKAEDVLRESEDKYKCLVGNIPEIIFTIDLEGKLTFVSQRVKEILGYESAETINRNILSFVPEEDRQRAIESLQKGMAGEKIAHFQTSLIKKSGERLIFECSFSRIYKDGAVIGAQGTAVDITERKKSEEALKQSEEKLRILFETVGVGVTVTDITGKIINVNKALLDLSGFSSKEEVVGRNGFEFISEKDRDTAIQALSNARDTGIGIPIELTLLRKDGSEYLCETNTTVMHDVSGNPVGLIVVQRDITERKRMEEGLQRKERYFRSLIEGSSDGILVLDRQGSVKYTSPGAVRLIASDTDRVGFSVFDPIHPDDVPKVVRLFERVLGGTQERAEIRVYHKDGSLRIIEATASNLLDDPAVGGVIVNMRDITERKKAEDAMRQSSKEWQSTFDASHDAICMLDTDQRIQRCNRAMTEMFGVTQELIGRHCWEIVHGTTEPIPECPITRTKSSLVREEMELQRGDRWFNVAADPVLDENRTIIGVVHVVRDITESKKAEKALQESEVKYRAIFDNAQVGMYRSKIDGSAFLEVNAKFAEILGLSRKELLEAPASIRWTNPKDRDRMLKLLKDQGGELDNFEAQVLSKNGDVKDVVVSIKLLPEKGWLEGTLIDITERRKAEAALIESEERFRLLSEAAVEGVAIHDKGVIVEANQALARMFGYEVSEMIGMYAEKLATPESWKVILQHIATGYEKPYEGIGVRKDGSNFVCALVGKPYKYKGRTLRVATFTDITERKRMDDALRVSEERYRLLADNASDVIMLMDMNAKPSYFSPSVTRLLGYSVEESLTGSMEGRVTPASMEKAVKHFLAGLDREKRHPGGTFGQTLELEMIHKNGSIVIVEMMVSFIRDTGGKPTGIMAILRDITGRKEAEAEIIELSNAFRATLDPILIFDMQGNVVNTNDAARRLFERDEVGVHALEAVAPEDRERVAATLQDLITNGRPAVVQFSIVTTSGRRVPIEASGNLMLDVNGKLAGVVVVERDLTERRQAEGRQKLAAEILSILNEPLAMPDAIGRILTAIKRETGFYAVGIRLRKDEDFPYFVQNGFSEDFLLTENTLVARDSQGGICRGEDGKVSLECTCGLVISGKTDPSNPLFTAGGSAWTNDSLPILDIPLDQDPRLHPRNRCIHAGFQSVALMPIRSGHDIVGLLQLNDRRKGCFTPEMIRFFEGIAASIGVALMRKQIEDALRESEKKMRSLFEVSPDIIMSIDRQGKILFINRATTRTIEQTIGTLVFDYIPTEYQSLYSETIEHVFRTGKSDRIETKGLGPGRRISWYEARFVALGSGDEAQSLMVVATDITERKQAEESLKESEEKFRTAFDSANTGMCLVSLSGNLIKVNDKMSKMLGYSVEELERMTVNDFTHPEDRGISSQFMKKAIAGEMAGLTFEKRYISKDGALVWGQVSSALVHDAEGESLYFITQVQDITERKRIEEALRESEERLRVTLEVTQIGVWEWNVKNDIWYASPTYYTMLGYEPVIGPSDRKVWLKRGHPDDVEMVTNKIKDVLNGVRDSYSYEARIKHADGSYRWNRVIGHTIEADAEGKPIRLAGVRVDITERKRAEEALKDSEIKYRDLFEHTLLGMEVIDGETGKVLFSNHSIARMFGFKSPQDMVGTNPMDYVPPEDREWVIQQLAQVMADPKKHDVATLRAKTEDGRMIWVTGSATSFEYEGKPAALMSLIEVTAAKEAEEALRESEEKFRNLAEQSPNMIFINVKGRVVYANRRCEEIMGYTREEFLSPEFDFRSLTMPEYRDMVKEKFQFHMKGQDVAPYEYAIVTKDGRRLDTILSTKLISYGGEQAIMGTITDISERKRAEEALRNSQERIKSIVATSQEWIWAIDAKGIHKFCNPAIENILGYHPDEILGYDALMLLHEDDIPTVRHIMAQCIELKTGWSNLVLRWKHKDGGYRYLEGNAVPILDSTGALVGFQGSDRDITVRKKAEEQLRETRDYMENLIEHANVPMVVWTPDFRITRFNKAFERLTGMKAQAVIGKELEIIFPRETRERSMSFMRTALKGARWEVVEMPVLNVQEDVRTVLWNISTIYAEDKKTPTAIIAQGQDITERKQAEEALRESEEMARSMLDNAAMGIYLLQNKKFLYVNPTFEKIMGYASDELVGQEAINYVHPSDRAIVRISAVENLKGVSVLPYEFRALRKDGKQIWVMEKVTSIRYKGKRSVIASFMETTEHRKSEEALERAYEELKTAHDRMVQSEKLRAMGEMASGIAHDFNNMLAVILGRTQLVIDDVKDDKVRKGIQIIEQAALDAAKTVKRLQDFARIRVEHPFEFLDVNEIIEGVLKMVETRRVELEQTKSIGIKVESVLGKVGGVSGDAAELREALLNILFNALDAMPTGGKLTVKSEQDEDWVQISIKDTGVGIPDKVKGKIFQPFFSTKASKGSGLGLSVTYGIIARHNGMIKFDSEVGKGTTFSIKLPLAAEALRQEAKKRKKAATKPANILTVDDESEVLQALGLTLEYFGHWVKGVTSGAEAVKAFKDGNYDLVITDLGMPGMSGWDVARAIKKINQDMPVLLITGWVIDLDEEQKKLVDGVIAKPFSRDSISSSISQVFPAKKKRVVKKKSAGKKKSE